MTDNALICPNCRDTPSHPYTAWKCSTCGGPLSWPGPNAFDRSDIDQSRRFIWRYRASLPDVDPLIGFGERSTPVASLPIGKGVVAAKLESQHPTFSFKDRGCALLVNAFARSGVKRLVEDSSGNAASSIAAYAARAGIPCTIFAPATASPGKLIQAQAYGAEVIRVPGSRADVATEAEARHDPEHGVFYASHNWHPWFIAGVATWALELWEERGFRAPEAIIAPAGSGSLILGAFAAFRMLFNGGEIGALPRLYAVQPESCAPLVVAMRAGKASTDRFPEQPTLAEGASIANPVRGTEVLAALRTTGGDVLAISEREIMAATRYAALNGLFIEPTSALAVAGAQALVEQGIVPATLETAVVLSGSGLKAQTAIGDLLRSSTLKRCS